MTVFGITISKQYTIAFVKISYTIPYISRKNEYLFDYIPQQMVRVSDFGTASLKVRRQELKVTVSQTSNDANV